MRLGIVVVVLAGLAALAGLAGCGGDDEEGLTPATSGSVPGPSSSTASPSTAAASTTVPGSTAAPSTASTAGTTSPGTAPPGTVPPGAEALVAVARADLASRLGVDAAAITVERVEAVTWPDTSLGCPQPGMAYAQVQVDGALIVLAVDGQEYEYHSGGSRPPFLCVQKG